MGDALVRAAGLDQRLAEAPMGLGDLAVERESLAIGGFGASQVLAPRARPAQPDERLGVALAELDRLLVLEQGLAVVAEPLVQARRIPVRDAQLARVGLARGLVGPARCIGFEARGVELARLHHVLSAFLFGESGELRQLEMRVGIVRLELDGRLVRLAGVCQLARFDEHVAAPEVGRGTVRRQARGFLVEARRRRDLATAGGVLGSRQEQLRVLGARQLAAHPQPVAIRLAGDVREPRTQRRGGAFAIA